MSHWGVPPEGLSRPWSFDGSASYSFRELSSSAAPIYHPLPTMLLFPGLKPLKLWAQTRASSFVFLSLGILPQRQQLRKQTSTSVFPNRHFYFLITLLCYSFSFLFRLPYTLTGDVFENCPLVGTKSRTATLNLLSKDFYVSRFSPYYTQSHS